jgi:carnitine O-acetyltransferase
LLIFAFFLIDGFFDAGMLLSALKAKEEVPAHPGEMVMERRNIGRRLKLSDY